MTDSITLVQLPTSRDRHAPSFECNIQCLLAAPVMLFVTHFAGVRHTGNCGVETNFCVHAETLC